MLVKNIFTRMEFETQENPKLCNIVFQHIQTMTTVISNQKFWRLIY